VAYLPGLLLPLRPGRKRSQNNPALAARRLLLDSITLGGDRPAMHIGHGRNSIYSASLGGVVHTTNGIESLNMSLRKVTKNRGSSPDDDAMLKLLYLALNNIAKKWTMPIRDWRAALTRFTILFDDKTPAGYCQPCLYNLMTAILFYSPNLCCPYKDVQNDRI
jgi:hypothetical protein